MPEYVVEHFFSNAPDRNTVRMRVVNLFSQEPAGQGKKDLASRFKYYVEELSCGNRVYLSRPANLHNGFDFVVHVDRVNFNLDGGRFKSNPAHEDIINDLHMKKEENPAMYEILFHMLEQVYNCEDINFAQANELGFNSGFSGELILATVKWLFIEQDIRYWNYSGRDMFWSAIRNV